MENLSNIMKLVNDFFFGVTQSLYEKDKVRNFHVIDNSSGISLNFEQLCSIGEHPSTYKNPNSVSGTNSFGIYTGLYVLPELSLRKENVHITLNGFEFKDKGNNFITLYNFKTPIKITKEAIPSSWPTHLISEESPNSNIYEWDILLTNKNYPVTWGFDLLGSIQKHLRNYNIPTNPSSNNVSTSDDIEDRLKDLKNLLG